MNPQQAFQVLVQAAQQARLTAQEHAAVAQAAEALGKALFPPTPEKKAE